MKLKQPTCTHLVEEALRSTDDFMSQAQIIKSTGCSANQASAALHQLRKYRVVDVVVNADGHGWWFALPKELDTRVSHVEERTPESKPRRKRKSTRKEPQS